MSPTSIETPVGQVAIPVVSPTLGKKDGAAVTELIGHLAATGASAWTGLRGVGKITYAAEDATSYDAMLLLLGGDKSRLDVTTSKGTTSIRLNQMAGSVQDINGHVSPLPVDTALQGIFPLDIVRTVRTSNKSMSVIDGGTVTIKGASLHRISVQRLALGVDPLTKAPNTAVTDFYFDSQSHLLVMTAALITLPETKQVRLLSVVSYSDYRMVGAAKIPFRFSESLQGKHYRTLQLSSVTPDATLTAANFTF